MTDDFNGYMDLVVTAFGTMREAILSVDDRMLFVLLPDSKPKRLYRDYYYG